MRVCHKQLVDEVLVLDLGSGTAAATAPLRLVGADRLGLRVAAMGKRNDDFFPWNQILIAQIGMVYYDFGAALITKGITDLYELRTDHPEQLIGVSKYV